MLIGLCGLAGAGKTTAIEILQQHGHGMRVYVGAMVTAEVKHRGLPRTPASEKLVREELRSAEGMGALAQRALPWIHATLSTHRIALVDAIYCEAERDIYRAEFGQKFAMLAVATSVENRATRLSIRNLRPLSPDDLATRDRYEIERLGTTQVMDLADHTICNDGSLDEFEQALDHFIAAAA
ncbi:dephospho-CoA kinase [Sphingomonas sp. PP-CE-3A-406]|uniref:AAA family ATPase n=1 Tax=Sphingomonas sp. PP-CE-3A-406 TaxID=2135659 RepID=UPI000EF9B147|nr:AAA family ATPase [Sphingomonas sp. PP-CE-3A-406]RMB54628.1 dephospho-CoA kinase [Sphingomonas sp. PP-CE-3A-406]